MSVRRIPITDLWIEIGLRPVQREMVQGTSVHLARLFFEQRGDPAHVTLTEAELAELILEVSFACTSAENERMLALIESMKERGKFNG